MPHHMMLPAAPYRLLITGGCGGIGRALAEQAIAAGLEVAVVDLPTSQQRAAPPQDAWPLSADCCDEDAMENIAEQILNRWNGLDGLVNLAGWMGELTPLTQSQSKQWEAVFSASYHSTRVSCKILLPLINKGGAVVNMSSGLADVCQAGYGAYSSAKAAIVALTKTLSREHSQSLRINAVSPGGIDTAFLRGGTGRTPQPERIDRQRYAEATPLGRLGTPNEVALPILFLLSPAASYITGQVLHINGGAWMP